MGVQVVETIPKIRSIKSIEKDPQELTLRELKDVCKHYFEGIKEESTYSSTTVERLGRIASLALEIIDHFEKYGN